MITVEPRGKRADPLRAAIFTGAVLEREINERLEFGVELFGNSPREHGKCSNVAFNVGGTWKLSKHLNLLFWGGHDIVGNTTMMTYVVCSCLNANSLFTTPFTQNANAR